jgi:hypothetical protein
MLFFLAHASKAVLIKMFTVCHGDHFRPSLADWHSTASYASVHVPVRRDHSLRYVDHVRVIPDDSFPHCG